MLRSAVAAAALLLAVAALGVVPRAEGFHLGGDESGVVRGVLAALREKAEAEDAARFAVAQHNRNQGAALEFKRVLKSKRQVVTGTLHDLILEAVDGGKKSLYNAKVWVKPWEDFKSVVEFRQVEDTASESSTASGGNSEQVTAELSLPAQLVKEEEARLNTVENGLSSDFSTST